MKRRELILNAGKFAVLSSLSSFARMPAWAQAVGGPKYLISINFDDGWDVTLGLDPQIKPASFSDSAFFLGYGPGDITRAAGLHFGPSAAGMAEFANQSIVINGVSMQGNVSHPDARRMAATGIIDRNTAGMAAMKSAVEAGRGRARVLIESSNGFNPGALDVDSTTTYDIVSSVNDQGNDSFLDNDGAFAQNAQINAKYGARLKKLLAANPDLKVAFDAANQSQARDSRGLLIGLGFATDYVRSVSLNLRPERNSLDTHSNHAANHQSAQKECWDQVVSIVRALKSLPVGTSGRTIFDDTMIVVTSEFSREINLNGSSIDSAGKEHNGYTNSYLILGGAVRGGYTLGGSIVQANALGRPALHTARNFDFRTGQIIKTAEAMPEYLLQNPSIKRQILPGHVVATMADVFGYRAFLDPVLAKLPTLPLRTTS